MKGVLNLEWMWSVPSASMKSNMCADNDTNGKWKMRLKNQQTKWGREIKREREREDKKNGKTNKTQ